MVTITLKGFFLVTVIFAGTVKLGIVTSNSTVVLHLVRNVMQLFHVMRLPIKKKNVTAAIVLLIALTVGRGM